jgi:transcription initiation factor IIE alpha subunit
MIVCLNCSKPLILSIDAKNNDFKCSECGEKYGLIFDKKNLTINHKNKHINFFFNDLPNCSRGFALKNVYEMYGKGYIECIKTLNSKYNQSDNLWQLSLQKLKDKLSENINAKLNESQISKQSYYCPLCHFEYSSDDALHNNFSCIACLSSLNEKNNMEDSKELKQSLAMLSNNWIIQP